MYLVIKYLPSKKHQPTFDRGCALKMAEKKNRRTWIETPGQDYCQKRCYDVEVFTQKIIQLEYMADYINSYDFESPPCPCFLISKRKKKKI